MKNVKRLIYLTVMGCALLACDDQNLSEKEKPKAVKDFIKQVELNPLMIDNNVLGDSWRLTKAEASYNDDDITKEFTYDYLSDAEFSNYKQYWTFGQNSVLMTFEGDWAEKNWDGYFEIFNQDVDLEERLLTIDYVYEDGEKTYTRNWTITSLTSTELVLTDENVEEEYFYRMTFRREDF